MDPILSKRGPSKKKALRVNINEIKTDEYQEPIVQLNLSVPASMLHRLLKMKKGESIMHEHDIIRFGTSELLRKSGY